MSSFASSRSARGGSLEVAVDVCARVIGQFVRVDCRVKVILLFFEKSSKKLKT